MADSLLHTPASVNSQECDCKWVRRAMRGSVIRLDIPRDTVSIDCNIKSARGHTRPPTNPTHEEAPHSLGRAPTVIDLGPHSPGSCSPSLVPYETEEDSNPENDPQANGDQRAYHDGSPSQERNGNCSWTRRLSTHPSQVCESW